MKSGGSAAAVAAWIAVSIAGAGRAAAQGDAGGGDDTAGDGAGDGAPDPTTDPDAPLTPPPNEVPAAVRFERIAAKGFYTEAGFGAAMYIGGAAPHTALGPSFTLRLGYDLFSWFSIGGLLSAASHEATVPPPPDEEWYQLYRACLDGRLGGRIGRIAFFVEGGAGFAYISSNVLQKVNILEPGERFSLAIDAGGGIEYQLENRHYALGLAGDWFLLPQFDAAQAIEARFYLRYTYGGS
jgi:hypothetical protein